MCPGRSVTHVPGCTILELLREIEVRDRERDARFGTQEQEASWDDVGDLASVPQNLGEVGRALGVFADEADVETKLGVRL